MARRALWPEGGPAAGGPVDLPLVTLTARPVAGRDDRPLPIHPNCDCDCACTVAQPGGPALLAAPVACYLELTAACPHHCTGCGNIFIDRARPGPIRPPLNAAQWRVIIEKLLPGLSLARLTGGEPTIHPEFLAIVDILEAHQVPFALLTSGRWPRPRQLVERLADCAGLRGLLISLHGPDAATHERFTNMPGSFAAAERAIRLAAGRGMAVAASAVLVRANLGRLRQTTEVALALGANHVVFNRFIGRPIPGFTLDEAGLRAALGEVAALERAGYPVRFGNCIPHCFEASSAHGCSAGFTYCTVDPWGNVRPCNHAPLPAGNLLRDELAAIWRSDVMARWRRLLPAACRGCAAFDACRGGCRAIALGPDPLMAAAKPAVALAPAAPAHLTLYAGAVPTPLFRALPDEPGACLVCEGRVLRLPDDARPLLDDLGRGQSLGRLAEEWGSAGLALVGWLYLRRFIDLTEASAAPRDA